MRPYRFQEYFKNDYKYGLKISMFFFIFFSIVTFINPSDFKTVYEMLIFSFLLSMLMGFSISVLLFWYTKIYHPNKRINILKNKSFNQFTGYDFINNETHLEKRSGKYETRIWFDIMSPFTINRSCINILIACKIKPEKLEDLSNKYNPEKILFSEIGILGICEFTFKTPKSNILENKLQYITELAESNKFEKTELDQFETN